MPCKKLTWRQLVFGIIRNPLWRKFLTEMLFKFWTCSFIVGGNSGLRTKVALEYNWLVSILLGRDPLLPLWTYVSASPLEGTFSYKNNSITGTGLQHLTAILWENLFEDVLTLKTTSRGESFIAAGEDNDLTAGIHVNCFPTQLMPAVTPLG